MNLTFYQIIPSFSDPKEEAFWKHLLKKEKMLVTNTFAFWKFFLTLSIHSEIVFIIWTKINWPFPKRKILDSFKLKGFEDDNSKIDENGKEFSKRVKNAMEKEEIARYEQFLRFQVFSKDFYCKQLKSRLGLGKD